MRQLTHLTGGTHPVVLGSGARHEVADLARGRRVFLVHPATLARQAEEIGALVDCHRFEVPDAEAAKTPQVLAAGWQEMARALITRTDLVVSLGGGATTDLAGFLAATWMRGVDVVHLPTTVLAMADAAIGGKTGINLPEGKNLVGSFHDPLAVLCDTDLLAGLPPREVSSGLAEVLKCGFIDDPVILDVVEADPRAVLDTTSPAFLDVLARAVAVKLAVVREDHDESTSHGEQVGRERLNYGHTLAHAIEAHEHFTWRHGEADAVGMVFAAELSRRVLGLDPAVVERTRLLAGRLGLPTRPGDTAWPLLRATMDLDKKARIDPATGRTVLRFIGLRAPARVAVVEDPDEALLAECFASLLAH